MTNHDDAPRSAIRAPRRKRQRYCELSLLRGLIRESARPTDEEVPVEAGGMGLATDLPIEKFWRDQRSMMITEGPIEILKMTLARHVLRTYG